jgi:hypothetical protein
MLSSNHSRPCQCSLSPRGKDVVSRLLNHPCLGNVTWLRGPACQSDSKLHAEGVRSGYVKAHKLSLLRVLEADVVVMEKWRPSRAKERLCAPNTPETCRYPASNKTS